MKTNIVRTLSVLTAALCLFSMVALSQVGTTSGDFKKAGGSGSQFLKIGVGSRAMGMGGAFASVADDISAIYWNPAGVASLDGLNFAVQHTSWFADMSHEFAGVSFPLGERIRAAASVIYFGAGDIEITTINQPEGTGANYSVNDLAVGLTVAADLSEEFSVGVTGKFVQNTIHDLTASGLAFDAGTVYRTGFRNLKIGMVITNFSGDFSFEGQSLTVGYQVVPGTRPIESQLMNQPYSLPLMFRAGLSMDVLENVENQKFTVAGDFVHMTDNPEKFNTGLEYVWNNLLAVRGGYVFNADELGLNIGGGLQYKTGSFVGSVDYAWSDIGKLGNIHRFGVSMKF